MSTSSIEAKRQLAHRVAAMPRLANALEQRELGYEAARLVTGIATPDTVDAWITRARDRTVRHLREEVDAAEMLARFANDAEPRPPGEANMKCVAAFESSVVSGAIFSEPNADSTLAAAIAQISAPGPRNRDAHALGRSTLKLRVRESTLASYRWLEDLLVRSGNGRSTCLRFHCESLIDSWKHSLGRDVAYGSVYARDRYRRTNPVCNRRDVHIVFRSHGGDDTDDNVTSLCTACHLEGVHGGHLTARGPASALEWTLGRQPHTVVRGRQRARD